MKADLNRYEDPWTAEAYDYQTQGRGNDVPFWLSLAEEAKGEVLEIACGTGRVLLPLARAGSQVTGLDVSDTMLGVARRKLAEEPAEVSARVTLVRADMTQFELGKQFDLVIIPFSAFQVLRTRADQRACLERCRAHLKPGRQFAVDVFNPDLGRLTRSQPVQEGPEEFAGPGGEAVRWSGETEYDLATQTLRSRWRYERTAPGGETTASEHLLELHYFFRFEMEWMLEACGFEIEALYGSFARSEFAADSPELIFVARKAGPWASRTSMTAKRTSPPSPRPTTACSRSSRGQITGPGSTSCSTSSLASPPTRSLPSSSAAGRPR